MVTLTVRACRVAGFCELLESVVCMTETNECKWVLGIARELVQAWLMIDSRQVELHHLGLVQNPWWLHWEACWDERNSAVECCGSDD